MNESIRQILINAKAQIESQKNNVFESENRDNFATVVRPQLDEADNKFNAAVTELSQQNELRKEQIKNSEVQKIKAKVDGEFCAVLTNLELQINGSIIE